MGILHCAWREVVGRPWRTLFNALAVAIGVGLVISLFSLTLAYQKAIASPFTKTATNLVISKPGKDTAPESRTQGVILPLANQVIQTEDVDKLAAISGAKRTASMLQLWSFDPGQFKVIAGLDPEDPTIGPAKARTWIKKGRFYESGERGVVVLESHFAKFYGYKVNRPMQVDGHEFTIVGIYEVHQGAQLTAVNAYMPLADTQLLARVGSGTVNSIYVELKDAGEWRQAIDTIHRTYPDLVVTSADSALAMSDSILALLNQLAWPAAGLIIAVCVLFVYRSLTASVWERIREFGTMKALGWRHRDVRWVLVVELFSQVALGAMLGLFLGGLSAYLVSLWQIEAPQISQAAPLPGTDTAGTIIKLPALFPSYLYLSGLCAALAIGFLVAFVVAARVAALKPAEAWRKL